VPFTASWEQMRAYWRNAYFPAAMARVVAQMLDVEQWMSDASLSAILREHYVVGPDSIGRPTDRLAGDASNIVIFSRSRSPK
jgi:hypothetical protein